jgi:hypothetical protein
LDRHQGAGLIENRDGALDADVDAKDHFFPLALPGRSGVGQRCLFQTEFWRRGALSARRRSLNHRSGSFAEIVGVCQKYSFADQKRVALSAWAAHVSNPGPVPP